MAAMSDYLENKVIDANFRGQSLGIPGNTWIGLTAAPLSDSSTAPYTTEFSGNNYSRVQVVSNLSSWMGTNYNSSGTISSGSNGTVSNNTAISFPAPTGGNWGVANSFGIFDAITGGNLLFYGQLSAPKTINNGDSGPIFSANTLSIQIDN